MNYTQYKADFFKRLQVKMWCFTLYLDLLVFVLDVVLSAHYFFNQKVIEPLSYRTYLILEIIIPIVLQCGLLGINRIAISKKNITNQIKNRICVYTILTQLMFISFFHIRYEVVIFLPSLIMLLAALLADRVLLRALFISTGIIELANIVVFFITNTSHFYSQKIIVSGIVLVVYVMIYIVSRSLLTFQKNQLHHIYDNYTKMRELTVELRLEPLTRLYNRTAFAGAVERYISLFNKKNELIYMAVLDLDDFKHINDNFGHATGDVVLISLSDLIIKTLGSNRSAFRYGGDEFVILFREKKLDEVLQILEKIRSEFNKTEYDFINGELTCSLSIGVAEYKPEMNSKNWFQAADAAAYKAKNLGKNRCCVAE